MHNWNIIAKEKWERQQIRDKGSMNVIMVVLFVSQCFELSFYARSMYLDLMVDLINVSFEFIKLIGI